MTTHQFNLAQPNRTSLQNWATNIPFQATTYSLPETIEQLQEMVHTRPKVRVIGAGHSFNDIADTTGRLISLDHLDKTVTIDRTRRTATVHAGMTYIELAPILHQAGYALPNMASLPHITVIGACATATHGSGDQIGNLATQVSGLEIVNAAGELIHLSRDQDGGRFAGMVVNLGGLGVVTKVTLDLEPAFSMQQQVYRRLTLANMEAHFDEIMSRGYSVSLFTTWQEKMIEQVWVKQVLPNEQAWPFDSTLFGATLATTDLHPVEASSTDVLTAQRGIPGPWYERLPHFHIRSTLTGGDELQSEYFVSREQAVEALRVVESLQEQMASLIKISEVRSMAADDLWLSPAYEQDCIGIHFSWYNRWPEVSQFLPILEAHLAPFQARPHWGKLFTMPPTQVRERYSRMPDFQSLLAEFDPQEKFCNSYLAPYVYGE